MFELQSIISILCLCIILKCLQEPVMLSSHDEIAQKFPHSLQKKGQGRRLKEYMLKELLRKQTEKSGGTCTG